MPALYLFNRRTLLAGDDLQLPSLATGFVFALELFIFLPVLMYYTIDLIFILPDDDGVDGGGGIRYTNRVLHNELLRDLDEERSLLNIDDYFALIEDRLPSMESQACADATSGFVDMTFPFLLLMNQIGSAIYCATSIWHEQKIFHLSSLGTPTLNTDLRAPLTKIIESKMTVLVGFNFLLFVYGISCTFPFTKDYIQCFPIFWWFIWFLELAIRGTQSILSVATLASIWRIPPVSIMSDSNSQIEGVDDTTTEFYQRHLDHLHNHNNVEMAEDMWRSRCEGCCRTMAVATCFLFGGQGIIAHASERGGENFYSDIARALADYFEGTLDVVPSDIALGFVLLRHIQAQRMLVARREALQQMRSLESRNGSYNDVMSASGKSGPIQNSSSTSLLFRWRRKRSLPDNTHQSANDTGVGDAGQPRNHGGTGDEESYETFSRPVLSPSNPDDIAVLKEGARFARHQLAIYTWVLYYYMFPVSGTFRLIGQSLRKKMCKNKTSDRYQPYTTNLSIDARGISDSTSNGRLQKISGDNFLRLHEKTMLAHLGIDSSDLVYASYESGFYESPYCIVVDRKWKSIVLSIRGSLTLEDCVVDVLLDPTPLDALGEKYDFDGRGQYCHGGVLECAQWLHGELTRHNILTQLLLGEDAEFPDYDLHIVGHSLGAGIGVILSLMLRKTYPTIRCTCYSPPGGLLSWKLATECSEFVNSFVLDSDIVPRLSLNNMERLRDEVLELIARVKMSKYDIAKRIYGLCGEVSLGDLEYLIQQNEDMLYPQDHIPDSDFMRQLRMFKETQQERRASRGVAREISLFPPGKIVHLVKTGQSNKCMHGFLSCITCGMSNSGFKYTPIRKENDDFNEIEISPTLWTDHFPNRVCIEIEKVANSFGIDTTLGSPSSSYDIEVLT